VGKRNYVFFYKFLFSINLLVFTTFTVSLAYISRYEQEKGVGMVISFVLTLLLFLVLVFVVGLLVFHSYLIVTGTTTNEKIKDLWPNKHFNPYSNRSSLINCLMKIRGQKTHPQFLQRRRVASDSDPNFLLRNVKIKKIGKQHEENDSKILTMPHKSSSSRPHSPIASENP
jgi:ABC-type transport system involved in multi-copper enzyme maturation permease subunit